MITLTELPVPHCARPPQEADGKPCPGHGMASAHEGLQAPICVVGLSHQTAPIEIRSRVGLTQEQVLQFLTASVERGLKEAVVLSTCNRTEVYFSGGNPEIALQMLVEHSGLSGEELKPYLYVKHCSCAACHLFRVATGLDSAVLGETEIVAQVKEAWRLAGEVETTGPLIDLLFKRSLEASKRVRTETDLCRSVTSTGSLAVRTIADRLGDLTDRQLVLLGAGKIATRIAKEFKAAGAKNVTIVNRTLAKAAELAEAYGAAAAPLDRLGEALIAADAVVTTIDTSNPFITSQDLHDLDERRNGRPLLIIDMGVPPNVEATSIASVELVNLDQLALVSEANADSRASTIPAALAILDEELNRFNEALAVQAAAPTIRALMARAESIKTRNLDWARERLEHLNEKELRVVEELAKRMMIGLLEAPIESLKTELSGPEHRAVAARLFGLNGVCPHEH